jgi:hypothetical protein
MPGRAAASGAARPGSGFHAAEPIEADVLSGVRFRVTSVAHSWESRLTRPALAAPRARRAARCHDDLLRASEHDCADAEQRLCRRPVTTSDTSSATLIADPPPHQSQGCGKRGICSNRRELRLTPGGTTIP